MQARCLPFIKIDPMLPRYVLLDLETTGAIPLRDRITEIALVRFDNGVEVARWQTLVNPEQPIPVFIQQLTGIDNEMVAAAPKFSEVADKLLSFLEEMPITVPSKSNPEINIKTLTEYNDSANTQLQTFAGTKTKYIKTKWP